MTRKDYVALANALRGTNPAGRSYVTKTERLQWEFDREAVADALAQDNPRFDHDRFMTACEYENDR